MLFFDKKNYRILKYIYSHDGVTSESLHMIFGNCEMFLISLAQESYIGALNEDGTFLHFGAVPFHTTKKTKWFTLPRGNCVVEDKRRRIMSWVVPVIISITALAISIFS